MDDSPVHVGVSLGPHLSHAAAVRGRRVLATASAQGPDPAEPLRRVARAADRAPASVVVDISRLLLDRVLWRPSQLSPVAMIRIVPRAATDPALGRHPSDVVERLITNRYTIPGGHDLFGHELRPIEKSAIGPVCAAIAAGSARCVAIVATGSPAQPRHEREVADAVQSVTPDAHISVAYEFGGQGLAAREATVVLNSALSAAVEDILDTCDAAVRRVLPGTPLHVARGDAGWTSRSRLRSLPVVALGAFYALPLLGAAHLAGERDCRVSLDSLVGDVRHGLVAVRPQAPRGLDAVLVVPTATLTGRRRADDAPLEVPDREIGELACVGAAVSRPTAWLDEIAFIESTAELEGIRRDAEARATAILTANGAAPGTADIVEMSTVAVPYSPSGTVRVRVRVAGSADALLLT